MGLPHKNSNPTPLENTWLSLSYSSKPDLQLLKGSNDDFAFSFHELIALFRQSYSKTRES